MLSKNPLPGLGSGGTGCDPFAVSGCSERANCWDRARYALIPPKSGGNQEIEEAVIRELASIMVCTPAKNDIAGHGVTIFVRFGPQGQGGSDPSVLLQSGYIKQYGYIMADAAGQHEQMPDAVEMANLLIEQVEHDAASIK